MEIDNIDKVAVGHYNIFVIKKDGTVWGLGYNRYGELGLGTSDLGDKYQFVQIPIDNVKNIYCGCCVQYAVKYDGTVYSTGWGNNGVLGTGSNQSYVFTKVDIDDVKKISITYNTAFVLKNDGTLYSCGYNEHGESATGYTSYCLYKFYKVPLSNNVKIKDVVCGNFGHTMVLDTDNNLYSTGYNANGQLGIGNTNNINRFIKVPVTDVKKILDLGYETSFILKNDNTIWGCGMNTYGNLGLGYFSTRSTVFVQIPDLLYIPDGYALHSQKTLVNLLSANNL